MIIRFYIQELSYSPSRANVVDWCLGTVVTSQCQQSLSHRNPESSHDTVLHGYQCGNSSDSRASSPWRAGVAVFLHIICLTHTLRECHLETNYKHGLPLGTKQLGERPG